MHPFPASESDAADGLRRLLFDLFFGFVLVALACLLDRSAWDVTLIPRLLALLAFLVLAVAVAAVPRVGRLLDVTVLREPVVLLYGGFMLVTCGSLAVAQNVSAGFTDLFRTLATFLTLCLACLILPIVPRWRERVVGIFVVAGLVAAHPGGAPAWVASCCRLSPDARRGFESSKGRSPSLCWPSSGTP